MKYRSCSSLLILITIALLTSRVVVHSAEHDLDVLSPLSFLELKKAERTSWLFEIRNISDGNNLEPLMIIKFLEVQRRNVMKIEELEKKMAREVHELGAIVLPRDLTKLISIIRLNSVELYLVEAETVVVEFPSIKERHVLNFEISK